MPGIQEALSKFSQIGVIDDLEQRKKVFVNVFLYFTFRKMYFLYFTFQKEEQLTLAAFEGATTQTVSGGARKRVGISKI